MRTLSWSRPRQGELFSPPAKLPQLPPEVRERMVSLLARMLNEHLDQEFCSRRSEVGDE